MPKPKNTSGCGERGCEGEHYSKGLCRYHYDLTRPGRGGSLEPREERLCSIKGCESPVHAQKLCQPHYRQMKRRERGLQTPGRKSLPIDQLSEKSLRNRGLLKGEHQFVQPTHCIHNHELTDENVYLVADDRYAGGYRRRCKICQRNATQRHRGREESGDAPVGLPECRKDALP